MLPIPRRAPGPHETEESLPRNQDLMPHYPRLHAGHLNDHRSNGVHCFSSRVNCPFRNSRDFGIAEKMVVMLVETRTSQFHKYVMVRILSTPICQPLENASHWAIRKNGNPFFLIAQWEDILKRLTDAHGTHNVLVELGRASVTTAIRIRELRNGRHD